MLVPAPYAVRLSHRIGGTTTMQGPEEIQLIESCSQLAVLEVQARGPLTKHISNRV